MSKLLLKIGVCVCVCVRERERERDRERERESERVTCLWIEDLLYVMKVHIIIMTKKKEVCVKRYFFYHIYLHNLYFCCWVCCCLPLCDCTYKHCENAGHCVKYEVKFHGMIKCRKRILWDFDCVTCVCMCARCVWCACCMRDYICVWAGEGLCVSLCERKTNNPLPPSF